jgi:hypothetical protein
MYKVYYIECPKCKSTYVGKTKNIYKRQLKHRTNTFDVNGDPYNRVVYSHFRNCDLENKHIKLSILVEKLENDEAKLIELEYINSLGDLNMLLGIMNDPNYYQNYRNTHKPQKSIANKKYYNKVKMLKLKYPTNV